MTDSMTTLLYVMVLAGWFLLMCVVLRCCSDSDSQSIFDLDEINLSAAGYHHKPTAIVDGQPVRFARVQPLGDSPQAVPGVGVATNTGHRQEGMALERLEIPTATAALPSAQAVWSPILALRTFVEPLTSRASAAFRNFHISFHDPEEEGAGGVGVTTMSTLPAAAAAAPPSPPGSMADEELAGAGVVVEQGIGGRQQKERSSPTAARAAAAAASAEHFWPPGSGGVELSAVSGGHDRAEGGGVGIGGGDGERKRVDTAEMVEQDERDECRVAV